MSSHGKSGHQISLNPFRGQQISWPSIRLYEALSQSKGFKDTGVTNIDSFADVPAVLERVYIGNEQDALTAVLTSLKPDVVYQRGFSFKDVRNGLVDLFALNVQGMYSLETRFSGDSQHLLSEGAPIIQIIPGKDYETEMGRIVVRGQDWGRVDDTYYMLKPVLLVIKDPKMC